MQNDYINNDSLKNAKHLAMPENLDADGKRAYNAIKNYLDNFSHIDTGGCKSFYSPDEWSERGEQYGTGSKLIIVYDGGDLRRYFNMDAAYEAHCMVAEFYEETGDTEMLGKPYDSCENMNAALHKEGLYFEECTGWYAAVYKI
jgi:hypothetical protein